MENDNNSELENDIHLGNENENENEESPNPADYFKVTPDNYTDSDSNTIIDFDDDEEDSKQQNQEDEKEPEESTKKGKKTKKGTKKNAKKKKKKEVKQEVEEVAPNTNQEGQEEEQENQEEDKGITDSNVKKLMKMNAGDKEGIIDVLMKDNLVKKSAGVKTEKEIKDIYKSKYDYIESVVGKQEIGNKKSTYGRKGFQIEKEEGNPEFIKDINIAASAVKDQLEKENQDVAKILFNEKNQTKTAKRITREQIDEKVKKALERKQKNLAKIEAQMFEERKIIETFKPVIHRKVGNYYYERRELDEFLSDQKQFLKKMDKKREELKSKTIEIDDKNMYKPHVDTNSEELAKKLITTNEPAYLRLYNRRINGKEKFEQKEKLRIEKKKEEAQKRKEKMEENRKQYAHIQSKINMGQKKEEKVVDKFGNIEKPKKENLIEKEREIQKENYIQKKMKKNKGKLLEIKEIPTYKILYKNFLKKYDEAIKSFENENLTEEDIHNLFHALEMISYPIEAETENNENNEENEKEETNVENPIKQDEKKLVNLCVTNLKNEQNQISKEDIKNFLICVVGLQKYHFYLTYKSEHEKEIEEQFVPPKCKKEDVPELIIKKMNEEILSKVDKNNEKNNKYAYKTSDGKIYISLEKGHAIKKDFNMLALNYRNSKKPSKDINTLMEEKRQFDFKPVINENTNKYYQKYQDKIISIPGEASDNSKLKDKDKNKDTAKTDPHMDYIEKILLQDKKRIYEIQKAKEEIEKNELKECTFKPKINENYVSKKASNEKEADNSRNTDNKKNRMIELYEKGTADIKKRKNKTIEQMEVEAQIKELTFKPKKISEKIPETKFSNDIHKEKEYKNLYQRLKYGRMERLVKDSTNDRYGLNKDLKKFVKQSKENKNNDFIEEEKISEEYIENSNNNNIIRNSQISKKEKNYSGMKSSSSKKNEEDNNNSIEQSSEEDAEKKEKIPLLIIDVNIRQGVKKKIYVYEGDTPEGLAEKFAKEHNLEEETKNKLQNLIHNHMLRLLTRIEEENQSISEKSQNTNNKK